MLQTDSERLQTLEDDTERETGNIIALAMEEMAAS
jgi:hypothetical protein